MKQALPQLKLDFNGVFICQFKKTKGGLKIEKLHLNYIDIQIKNSTFRSQNIYSKHLNLIFDKDVYK